MNLYAAYRSNFPQLDSTLLTTESGDVYSYGDAERYSAKVANYLCLLGLQPGDRVSAQIEKSPQGLFLFLGVLRAGLVFHPLNTAYTEDEVRFFLLDAGTSLLVCDSDKASTLEDLCCELAVPHLLTLDGKGAGSLWQGVASSGEEFDTVEVDGRQLAALVYSSGTTGRPKGIMLSHGNLLANASVLVDYWGFQQDDCLLHALPIFHVHGLFVAIGCVLMSGASMRWLRAFSVEAVLDQLAHTTVMMGVPTYYTRLLSADRFTADVCQRVRLFISGSAPLLADTFTEFEQRTGHAILERYGMTETGMNTSNPLKGERRAGTVGFPLPGVSARICSDDDKVLPPGEVGGLQVQGPNVFSGYWNMPDKTAEDFTADGYFITGDQAVLDEDGYVSIVGRSKDMVITGGLNVYPKEVELLIDGLPGVLESAVIGIPDADFGEAVVAAVVAQKGVQLVEEQVISDLKGLAANFKIPKRVYFLDQLPRNAMGKVQKNVLRQRLG